MADEKEKAAKNKKLNKMKAADLDNKLNELKTSQGGLQSKYAHMILQRKKTLGK
ncbi:MAG: hypothetical protein NTZ26_07315 [Candidatus Aminicenantes bacterium]|nr:hypothetical protein [Candidatus Aminicenantes bacterium]